MAREVIKNERKYYQCEECLLFYTDIETAEKCQKWCSKHKSCNLEIIKASVSLT